jgi:hypothetical protein
MKRQRNNIEYYNKNQTQQKFPLWLLLVIIILLCLAAYVIYNSAAKSNVNNTNMVSNFSYKF